MWIWVCLCMWTLLSLCVCVSQGGGLFQWDEKKMKNEKTPRFKGNCWQCYTCVKHTLSMLFWTRVYVASQMASAPPPPPELHNHTYLQMGAASACLYFNIHEGGLCVSLYSQMCILDYLCSSTCLYSTGWPRQVNISKWDYCYLKMTSEALTILYVKCKITFVLELHPLKL